MKNKFLFLALLVLFPVVALAEGVVVPDGDPLATLLQIILNWKATAPIAIASGVVVALVQVLKSYLPEFPYKKAIVVGLSCAYAVIQSLISGLGLVPAVVLVMITSGGAIALYEAIKNPLLNKKA